MSSIVASHLLFRVLLVAAAILSSSVCHQGIALAESECINEGIPCYNCDSAHDPKCGDPWNHTEQYENGIPTQKCFGCCVKIVSYKTTKTASGIVNVTTNVRRLCTTSLQINLFLVDHVCMQESDGNGHMCFCETDLCNSAHPLTPWFENIIPSLSAAYMARAPTDPGAEDQSTENPRDYCSSTMLVTVAVFALHIFIGHQLVSFENSEPPSSRPLEATDVEGYTNCRPQSVKERFHGVRCIEQSKVHYTLPKG